MTLLTVERLGKIFTSRRGPFAVRRARAVAAVQDVSFTLQAGEVLGVVGSSGSGKTTLARLLLRMLEPSTGRVRLNGTDVLALSPDAVRQTFRPRARLIFQDPDAALNPAYTIGEGLARALRLGGQAGAEPGSTRIGELLEQVGLSGSYAAKYPDELSGGEKRRLGICRALCSDPKLIVADEPLSGLDVVLQERVLALLLHEQARRGFGLILVSHDLDRVNQVCDRVLVMYAGRVVEEAVVTRVADRTGADGRFRHPYAMGLERARDALLTPPDHTSPRDGPDDSAPAGRAPVGRGCAWRAECARYRAMGEPEQCGSRVPELAAMDGGGRVACHFPDGP